MVSSPGKLRKRSLPVGSTGRRRTRHQVTLSPDCVKKINARMAAAKDAGYRTTFSGEIERAVDEAEGNLRSARHEFGNALNPLRLQLGFMKSELLSGRRITPEDLKPIEEMVAKMAGRLEPTPK
jgi:hypothetical protein